MWVVTGAVSHPACSPAVPAVLSGSFLCVGVLRLSGSLLFCLRWVCGLACAFRCLCLYGAEQQGLGQDQTRPMLAGPLALLCCNNEYRAITVHALGDVRAICFYTKRQKLWGGIMGGKNSGTKPEQQARGLKPRWARASTGLLAADRRSAQGAAPNLPPANYRKKCKCHLPRGGRASW